MHEVLFILLRGGNIDTIVPLVFLSQVVLGQAYAIESASRPQTTGQVPMLAMDKFENLI